MNKLTFDIKHLLEMIIVRNRLVSLHVLVLYYVQIHK